MFRCMVAPWLNASAVLAAAVIALAPAAAVEANPAPPSGPQTVVVQAGDTLWGLAHRNGTTVADLQRLNDSDPN